MKRNPLEQLSEAGQSIWLDFLRRRLVTSGKLRRLIEEDALRGVTSNPKIFEKSIDGSDDYDDDVRAMALSGKSVPEIYQALTVTDVQMAADEFRPVYDKLDGADGFVSLEVNPHLAHDTQGTIEEARRLWNAVDRPNVLIKIPATREGLPAISRCLGEGININVTLLFGLPRYREVAEAYVSGIESFIEQGGSPERLASVASFFLSRIDVLVDQMLEKKMDAGGPQGQIARDLHGQLAIASARQAYQVYKEVFASSRFETIEKAGARPQRVLWASTSTKNPEYSDVKYVEALIGPNTVNTLPMDTLDAYRDHGKPEPRLEQDLDRAREAIKQLATLGIDIDAVTEQLENEGIDKFNKPFDRLTASLERKCAAAQAEPVDVQYLDLGETQSAVDTRLDLLEEQNFAERLWRKDPTLWTRRDDDQDAISHALGWLSIAERMDDQLPGLRQFAQEVRESGFRHVVHMGMGGSSLTPLVFTRTLDPGPDGLPLSVLDTTAPDTLRALDQKLPLGETLFIVASKSGTTTEPLAFCDYFYDRLRASKGDQAGRNFVAVTDPGSPLVDLAAERGFRKVFLNDPDIGGRYSALSNFGLLPAALMDIDIEEMVERALRMTNACDPTVPVRRNPGIILGAVMGELALLGRDKVTLIASPSFVPFGLWLEQLLAESTGKDDKGLVPVIGVADSDSTSADARADDRLIVYLRLDGESGRDKAVDALRKAGSPVVTIRVADRLDFAQEFVRWEIAVATAGHVLGVNPFDQPNVQESKDKTRSLLKQSAGADSLPEDEGPAIAEDGIRLYTDAAGSTFREELKEFFSHVRPGDYVALLAYVNENEKTNASLDKLSRSIHESCRVPVSTEYGPRYLHSTGQLYKGGPNRGLYLLITADSDGDVPIPGKPYGFDRLNRAQALGDLDALRNHHRRVRRVHLNKDVPAGIAALATTFQSAEGHAH